MRFTRLLRALLCAGAVAAAAAGIPAATAATITKSPDLGAYWDPLNANGGTYVYANSFVAPVSGVVTDLGFWITGGGSDFRLQVLGDTGGNGPDGGSVLATTDVLNFTFQSLTFVNAAPLASTVLMAGQTYWFAASTVGLGGAGPYRVGGHTQNSTYADNGSFWYSNEPNGIVFDGQGLTPEIAFSVTIGEAAPAIPAPASIAVFGFGLLALAGAVRARRAPTL